MASQSIEPNIADLVNGWLKSYKLDYKLEQEKLNSEIDNALNNYHSKSGGKGGNRPDAKLLKTDKNLKDYPILIEYKGYKDKLEKLDLDGKIENITAKNEPNFKNIKDYAVNGAVHYSNALLHYTKYSDIIAIGVTGYKDKIGNIHHQIGVYFVSKENYGIGQKIGDFSDLSFLKDENFDDFVEKIKSLHLSEEDREKAKEQREKEIDKSLKDLNNDIYKNEEGLGENDRVYLVAASIIATIGIPGKVPMLEKDDLKSQDYEGGRDGDIILNRIKAFLAGKNIPDDKKNLIIRTLSNTLLTDNINRVVNGETQLKRVFTKIVDDLGIYYKIGLTTDFTGKLFNEMYSWLGFTQDKLNDVVLTPASVSNLLVKLARVNKDSYVWDFATGSAGLLVAAMNEMLKDAKENITSPQELAIKQAQIKAEQLLGLELLSSVYMLAILNMIMMGDGSSNILNKNSLTDFDGKYGFGKTNEFFPADAFILNPPYSADGKGMIFVEKALNMMNKGYAAIIIHNTAGKGKAKDYNKRILERHSLLASIKMPNDLFIGKASVQTNIYVFKIAERHDSEQPVKFIDFSNDGFTRTDRKNTSGEKNLKDVNNAKGRYNELVNLVKFGGSKLKLLTNEEYYENKIDPNRGDDWNQLPSINTKPVIKDFSNTVASYLDYEISNVLRENNLSLVNTNDLFEKNNTKNIEWVDYELGKLFLVKGNPQLNKESFTFNDNGEYPYFTRSVLNNGIAGYVDYLDDEHKIKGNCISVGMMGMKFFYMEKDFYAGQFTKRIIPKDFTLNKRIATFFTSLINRNQVNFQEVLVRNFEKEFYTTKILLPTKNGKIDFDFMEKFIGELEKEKIEKLENYFKLN